MFGTRKSSIYKEIKGALKADGSLSENFLLPPNMRKRPACAPGEWDARMLMLAENVEESPEKAHRFMGLLEMACRYREIKREKEFIEFLEDGCVFSLIDPVSELLFDEVREINLLNLMEMAYEWCRLSGNEDLVKLGISLLGMLNLTERKDCRDVIFTLGKYDEFTLYSLYAISGWKEEEKLFRALLSVLHGWGKMIAEEWGQGRPF